LCGRLEVLVDDVVAVAVVVVVGMSWCGKVVDVVVG
jgi:hypothetical protein